MLKIRVGIVTVCGYTVQQEIDRSKAIHETVPRMVKYVVPRVYSRRNKRVSAMHSDIPCVLPPH